MQLILRQPAATQTGGEPAGVVVAASPDTFGREQWQWDVRLVEALDGYTVVVSHNPDSIAVAEERIEIGADYEAIRDTCELWLAVVVDRAVNHGGFRLESGDVAVWEGDDPTRLNIRAVADSASLHVVRIRRRDGKAARWVP